MHCPKGAVRRDGEYPHLSWRGSGSAPGACAPLYVLQSDAEQWLKAVNGNSKRAKVKCVLRLHSPQRVGREEEVATRGGMAVCTQRLAAHQRLPQVHHILEDTMCQLLLGGEWNQRDAERG